MSRFKFYKGEINWIYNEGIVESVDKTVPAGHYRRSINGTKVEIKGKDNDFQLFSPNYAEVTEIQKSATPDDNYTSIAEFITATEAFFAGSSINVIDNDGDKIDENNPLPTTPQFGVPNTFTKQTTNSRTFNTQKGQLNHFRIRQAILNEHVESAREIQSTITATNIVGQIFKASQDNINGINITIQSGNNVLFDDFESYADTAALQAAWITSDPAYPATLETDVVYEGDKAMQIPSGGATGTPVGTEWAKFPVSVDYTNWTVTFYMYNDRSYTDVKLRVFAEDSLGNTSSAGIVNQDANTWEYFEFPADDLLADAGTPADISDIVKFGFRLEQTRNNSNIYIDRIVSFEPPGSIDLELWDMGTELPTSGVTSLNDGTQYTELGDRGINGGTVAASVRLDLISGKRQYFVRPFIAGTALEIPGNTLLIPNNYYAIIMRYVDGNTNVYGPNTSFEYNYYNNGFAFTAPDNSTPITAIGQYSDLQFSIFSTQDAYINTILRFYDSQPGNKNSEFMNVEDKNMNITDIIFNDTPAQQSTEIELKDRTMYFPKGSKFEDNVNMDFASEVTQITLLIGYMYEPPTVNG